MLGLIPAVIVPVGVRYGLLVSAAEGDDTVPPKYESLVSVLADGRANGRLLDIEPREDMRLNLLDR